MLATAMRAATAFNRLPIAPFDAREMSTAIAALDRIGLVISLEPNATIFFETGVANSYFKVFSGVVRGCKLLSDGRRLISDFYLAGDFFGLTDDGEHLWSAEAVTSVTFVRWTKRSVDALAEWKPVFGKCLRSMVSDDIASAREHMLLLGRKDAIERIASFLLMMADRGEDPERVSLPMTRLDIADYLGLTVETVSRTLGLLKSRRLIRLHESHEVIFLNRDAIEDLANAT
jgi:CRP-like cAMP-binding protein